MSVEFTFQRRVEFRDTDAAGIAHFSAFFVWMEQAEHAALRHLGLSIVSPEHSISWPRVSAHCDFQSAVHFEDELQIRVRLTRLGSKSVTYGFDFRSGDRQVASGQMTAVCCRLAPGEPLQAVRIPEEVAEKLRRLS